VLLKRGERKEKELILLKVGTHVDRGKSGKRGEGGGPKTVNRWQYGQPLFGIRPAEKKKEKKKGKREQRGKMSPALIWEIHVGGFFPKGKKKEGGGGEARASRNLHFEKRKRGGNGRLFDQDRRKKKGGTPRVHLLLSKGKERKEEKVPSPSNASARDNKKKKGKKREGGCIGLLLPFSSEEEKRGTRSVELRQSG